MFLRFLEIRKNSFQKKTKTRISIFISIGSALHSLYLVFKMEEFVTRALIKIHWDFSLSMCTTTLLSYNSYTQTIVEEKMLVLNFLATSYISILFQTAISLLHHFVSLSINGQIFFSSLSLSFAQNINLNLLRANSLRVSDTCTKKTEWKKPSCSFVLFHFFRVPHTVRTMHFNLNILLQHFFFLINYVFNFHWLSLFDRNAH